MMENKTSRHVLAMFEKVESHRNNLQPSTSGDGHIYVAEEEKYPVTQKGVGPGLGDGEEEEKREETADDWEDNQGP